jgi:hypothetical protein
VWKVSFAVGQNAEIKVATAQPVGRSSWDYWTQDYGKLASIAIDSSDPNAVSTTAAHSGMLRLRPDSGGNAFAVESVSAAALEAAKNAARMPADAGTAAAQPSTREPSQPSAAGKPTDAGTASSPAGGTAGAAVTVAEAEPVSTATSANHDAEIAPVGPVIGLALAHDSDPLRAHTWVRLHMRAADSQLPLHAYEVRIATEPITDDITFIRNGRQAKNATDAAEGATLLSLPTDVPAGQPIDAVIGDLAADTHYYIGVRATDELNRHGPIDVAEISTTTRRYATVTPCFIASVAYGSPLAGEVGALRRLRDRHLLPQLFGRLWVHEYYRVGARLAAWVAPHPTMRDGLRALLGPLVSLARTLE